MWVLLDEAHVTNIAVREAFRGRGLGERLFREMMAVARMQGAKRMTLEVRVSNERAQRLYRKLGFEPSGVRPGYYTDNGEDALIMWADLPPVPGEASEGDGRVCPERVDVANDRAAESGRTDDKRRTDDNRLTGEERKAADERRDDERQIADRQEPEGERRTDNERRTDDAWRTGDERRTDDEWPTGDEWRTGDERNGGSGAGQAG
jgi:hypothetical protein